ncbi:MAG TPA: hypothetical protein VF226_18700 [Hyphomicrobiaceae bacterium]
MEHGAPHVLRSVRWSTQRYIHYSEYLMHTVDDGRAIESLLELAHEPCPARLVKQDRVTASASVSGDMKSASSVCRSLRMRSFMVVRPASPAEA